MEQRGDLLVDLADLCPIPALRRREPLGETRHEVRIDNGGEPGGGRVVLRGVLLAIHEHPVGGRLFKHGCERVVE